MYFLNILFTNVNKLRTCVHVLHECFVASFHVRSRPQQKELFLVEHQFGTRVFIAVALVCY